MVDFLLWPFVGGFWECAVLIYTTSSCEQEPRGVLVWRACFSLCSTPYRHIMENEIELVVEGKNEDLHLTIV